MARKKKATDPEIHLAQALEEEYICLHKGLPRDFHERYQTDESRLQGILELIHQLDDREKRTGVCLSGGGIRSATFSLGVLQGLARHNLLNKFHYLSTVSGGGYVGAWLTAWINREAQGLKKVAEQLGQFRPKSKLEPEPEPLRRLREYSNFLTPKISMLSADVWTFIAIYLRNLAINWLVLIPLILAVLAIPRFCLSIIRTPPGNPIWSWLALVFGLASGAMAIAYAGTTRPTAGDALKPNSFFRRHNSQEAFLLMCLLPILLSAVLLTTFWAWTNGRTLSVFASNGVYSAIVDALSFVPVQLIGFMTVGVLMHLAGWILASIWLLRFRMAELIFVLVTGSLGGLLLWVAASKVLPNTLAADQVAWGSDRAMMVTNSATEIYVCLAAPLFLIAFLLGETVFVAISSRELKGSLLVDDEDREWLARLGGWLIIAIVVWSVFNADVVFGPAVLWKLPGTLVSIGGLSGLLALLAGRSGKMPPSAGQSKRNRLGSVILDNATSLAALVFVIVLVGVLSFGTTLALAGISWGCQLLPSSAPSPSNDPSILENSFGELDLLKLAYYTPPLLLGGFIVGLTVFAITLARIINLNKFSLHAAYRNRLIRAFLGASREARERKPNPFTGFDPSDNLQMHELRPGLIHPKSFNGWHLDKHDPNRDWGFRTFVKGLTGKAGVNKVAPGDPSIKLRASEYLFSHLSPTTKVLLRNYTAGAIPSRSLKASIIASLNRILETQCLCFSSPFAELPITEPTNRLIHYLADADSPLSPPPVEPGQTQTVASLVNERLLTNDEPGLFRHIKQKGHEPTGALPPGPLRGVYRIALNRLLLDQIYTNEIIPCEYPLPPFKLMHVVNTALNLVHGKNLAWQDRKAEPFSISPLHSGNLHLGYRDSRHYGGADGVSLGTAATISGAAASSNMGYYSSSSVITFVLTLFNARLGWWLGNPGPKGAAYYRLGYPRATIYPIIAEAFGWTDDDDPYVLLSDGGHFENLGLYEMVLRRCHVIVAIDGSQDAECTFGDIGNAVRKIRIDLGIPVEFDNVNIYSRSANKDGKYCALGRIRYSSVDKVSGKDAEDGVLIYIKPAFYGKEPRDVFTYAKVHDEFPHETTADQWFGEPQFESHRMLGSHVMEVIAGSDNKELSVCELVKRAYEHSRDADRPDPSPWLTAWLKRKETNITGRDD